MISLEQKRSWVNTESLSNSRNCMTPRKLTKFFHVISFQTILTRRKYAAQPPEFSRTQVRFIPRTYNHYRTPRHVA